MTMTASGVAKLIEECGELTQILGKKLAYWHTDEHPDGKPIHARIQEEMGDVLAAIWFTAQELGLDQRAIQDRAVAKRKLFDTWQAQIDNNDFAIDGNPIARFFRTFANQFNQKLKDES